jgi:hypothetical protein
VISYYVVKREYEIEPLVVNNRVISKLIIDSHVDSHVDKHADHIDDELIKLVVRCLNGEVYLPIGEDNGFRYFATNLKYEEKWYKLVWLLERDDLYIGVITVYKDRRIK